MRRYSRRISSKDAFNYYPCHCRNATLAEEKTENKTAECAEDEEIVIIMIYLSFFLNDLFFSMFYCRLLTMQIYLEYLVVNVKKHKKRAIFSN